VNRRGFISLLAGSAGAVLVPWRGTVEPVISLPPRSKLFVWPNGTYWNTTNSNFSNAAAASLTQESLEEMLVNLKKAGEWSRLTIVPRQLIVSPKIKKLIDTDPVIRRAAEMALNGEYLPEELGLYDTTRRS
jgi:hypothetical protein